MVAPLSLVLSCLIWLWAASRLNWPVFTFLIVIPLIFFPLLRVCRRLE